MPREARLMEDANPFCFDLGESVTVDTESIYVPFVCTPVAEDTPVVKPMETVTSFNIRVDSLSCKTLVCIAMLTVLLHCMHTTIQYAWYMNVSLMSGFYNYVKLRILRKYWTIRLMANKISRASKPDDGMIHFDWDAFVLMECHPDIYFTG